VDYGSGKVFNNPRSSVNQYRNTYNSYTWETFATYQKTFAENHNTTFTLGTSAIRDWGDNISGTGFDVPNNAWEFAEIQLANGISETKNANSFTYDSRLSSFFGRLQYDFKGKYLLSAMIRRDGSSDFSPENRIDYFSSVTAGWTISEEAFLKDSETINFLKLRGSYGALGNNTGADLYRALLSGEGTYVLDGAITNGVANGRIPNPEAQWETAKKFNVGLDLNMFNNKVTIVTDYFIEDREDLLISNFPVSGIFGGFAPGAGLPTVNAGTTRNTGIELAVGYKHVINDIAVLEPGQPVGYFLGYKTDGIFQNQAEVDASAQAGNASPGDIRFVDTDGSGDITDADRVNIGKPQADYNMGLNLSFDYKNWDFGTYMYAEIGDDVVKKLGMSKLRIYALLNNPFTLTKYNGYDPAATNGDAIGGGIDYGFYPVSKQYIIGLNLSI